MNTKRKISSTFNNPLLNKPEKNVPKNIAIIGSGTIGPDIGYYLKTALLDTTIYLVDIEEKPLIAAKLRIDTYIIKAKKLGKITPEAAKIIEKTIIYTTNYNKICNCELIIEAATEDISLKRNIFSKIESLVSKNTILTSNTSSIPAKRIFNKIKNPTRTAVTHFFAPAWKSLPIEVVGWEKTNQKTVDFLCWLFASTGKIPITTRDSICFMLDRIFDNWCNEAAYLLSNASASQIDKTLEQFVYAGPFFVLNMAKGNPIIWETNSLQMEEGKHYKPSDLFNSVDKWLTCKPGSNLEVSTLIKNKIIDRSLGILFSQSFDIIDRKIGSISDLNMGCELALGFRKGPIELMELMGETEVQRISEKFQKERPGFPRPTKPLGTYKKFKRFILEDKIDNVKIITIRRPQAMNAINEIVTNEILDILVNDSDNSKINGFIITGFGKKAFSAGADIGNFPKVLGNYKAAVKYAKECAKVQEFMDVINKPIVAAINGVALGGGFELAIRCHGIVADKKATFQFPEVSLGILPGIGGCIIPYRKWPKGTKTFNEMIMLSKKINVEEANTIGMIDSIAEGYDSLIEKSLNLVYILKDKTIDTQKKYKTSISNLIVPEKSKLMKSNLSCETVSIIAKTIKDGMNEKTLSTALNIGYEGFGRSACTNSAKEGISAFLERRQPIFNN